MVPHTYIFGAKAAPSYVFAKEIIELINAVAKVINNDPQVSKYMQIVFMDNYGVSMAEKIIPACDISEQISTAGKEASGTSNMKLMMNGAITLGTLDGANVEITDCVGKENSFIFGLKVKDIEKIIPACDISEQISTAGKEASGTSNMKLMMNGAITLGTLDGANVEITDRVGKENSFIFGLKVKDIEKIKRDGSYSAWDEYNINIKLRKVLDSLFNGPWCEDIPDRFKGIFNEVMNHNDEYFIFKDFDAYLLESKKIENFYLDKKAWASSCLVNIAKSGYFSSDRTIEGYNKDIWHLTKIDQKYIK